MINAPRSTTSLLGHRGPRIAALAIIALLTGGCASRSDGGLPPGHTIEKTEHVVVVPISDAIRRRVPVPVTGPRLTAALAKAFQDAGYHVTVAASPAPADIEAAVAGGGTLLIAGVCIEWTPDLRLTIAASRPKSDDLWSWADRVIGRGDIDGREPGTLLPQLAAEAVERLIHPPPEPAADSVSSRRGR